MKRTHVGSQCLSFILALIFIFALLPCGASASTVDSGTYEDLSWSLSSDGVLTVSGSGEIRGGSNPPWASYKDQILSLVIERGVTVIGAQTFYSCTKLSSVSIPDTVTDIYGQAFAYCSSLTEVVLPEGLVTLGNGTFFYCTGLTAVNIPESMTEIEASTFSGCWNLRRIAIPANVASIGTEVFRGCSSLEELTVDPNNRVYRSVNDVLFTSDKTVLLACAGAKTGDYTVPDGVKTIEIGAFNSCHLTSITIPDSVTYIGRSTFGENGTLKSIRLPLGITELPNDMFLGSTALETVDIPAGVTSIGNSAFNSCDSLTSVSIPASVVSVGRRSFTGCKALKDVYYGGSKAQWNEITFGEENEPLLSATIHYDSAESFPSPVLIGAEAGAKGITVSWNAVPGATQYRVYRKTGSGGWNGLVGLTGTSYLDTNVTGGTSYTYTVKAWNGTVWSDFDAKGVTATAVYGAPVLKSASAGANGITVTWNAVPGATQYRVYRKTGSGSWNGRADVTGTSYTDTNVTGGTSYTYTVKAWNGSVWSDFDSKGVTATAQAAFGAPVLKSASAGANGITVTWGAVSGASKYRVYRKTGSGSWTGLTDVTGTSYTDTNVVGGTAYTYTVRAWSGSVWSSFDTKGVTATAQAAFGAPVLKSATADVSGVTVTWNAVSGAKKYRLYRKTGSEGWTGVVDVTGTGYLDASVVSGKSYTYTVKAWNGSTWSGYDAKGITVTASAVFSAPKLIGASAGASGITVTWNAVAGATKYRVYRKSGSGGWTGLADVTATGYVDASVTSGTSYTYTVKAWNGSTWSSFDTKGVTATAAAVFSAPVLKGASAGTNGITVTWNAVSGAKKYRLYRKTGSEGWTGVTDLTGTSYTDASVTSGRSYTYTVKAWNGSVWSSFDAKGVTATAK